MNPYFSTPCAPNNFTVVSLKEDSLYSRAIYASMCSMEIGSRIMYGTSLEGLVFRFSSCEISLFNGISGETLEEMGIDAKTAKESIILDEYVVTPLQACFE